MSVNLDTEVLLRLISQLQIRGGAQDLSSAINSAIELWMREQAKLSKGSDPASVRGYQWKTLFLPEGTELRSWSYGEYNYARVIGDEIIHKGKAVSPNQFAQSFARSTRNAWEDVRVRRPDDKQFKQASLLRQELAKQQAQPQTAVAAAPAALSESAILALLAALQVQTQAHAAAPATATPRNPSPGEGWDLPERRKFRYRLEDVAY
ncbi:hypothetical protein GM676_10300 [Duganella radicis]|uniref:Uncharacterized protein n=2 Tax=Duganella radicis TaxID=551988 RepID=A0A6L6PI57_9BURK|nr:hypothetical protein [Duganella radicis]